MGVSAESQYMGKHNLHNMHSSSRRSSARALCVATVSTCGLSFSARPCAQHFALLYAQPLHCLPCIRSDLLERLEYEDPNHPLLSEEPWGVQNLLRTILKTEPRNSLSILEVAAHPWLEGPVPACDEMEAELKSRFQGILQGAPRNTTFYELGSAPYNKAISLMHEALKCACGRSNGEFSADPGAEDPEVTVRRWAAAESGAMSPRGQAEAEDRAGGPAADPAPIPLDLSPRAARGAEYFCRVEPIPAACGGVGSALTLRRGSVSQTSASRSRTGSMSPGSSLCARTVSSASSVDPSGTEPTSAQSLGSARSGQDRRESLTIPSRSVSRGSLSGLSLDLRFRIRLTWKSGARYEDFFRFSSLFLDALMPSVAQLRKASSGRRVLM